MNLQTIMSRSLSYCDPTLKDTFHRVAKRQLRKLAKHLDLSTENYDLRSNKAGIAVSGEVTLHADSLYVQVSQSPFGPNRGGEVMYRTCKHRRDCTGGPNHFADAAELDDPETFATKLEALRT